MKNKVKSIFKKKGLRVLSKKETNKIKGGNSSSSSTTNQDGTSGFIIEDVIQI